MTNLTVLCEGYSNPMDGSDEGGLEVLYKNYSCTLIQGAGGYYPRIIIDTMNAWSVGSVVESLMHDHNLTRSDIDYCISTHSHPDHMGNNNQFLRATHIVGNMVYRVDEFDEEIISVYKHDFSTEGPYEINDAIKIASTKGHTLNCVSVICKNTQLGGKTVAVVGDLFQHQDDIDKPEMWRNAGSEAPEDQLVNRYKIACAADYIVPGHGPMFKVTTVMRQKLFEQANLS